MSFACQLDHAAQRISAYPIGCKVPKEMVSLPADFLDRDLRALESYGFLVLEGFRRASLPWPPHMFL